MNDSTIEIKMEPDFGDLTDSSRHTEACESLPIVLACASDALQPGSSQTMDQMREELSTMVGTDHGRGHVWVSAVATNDTRPSSVVGDSTVIAKSLFKPRSRTAKSEWLFALEESVYGQKEGRVDFEGFQPPRQSGNFCRVSRVTAHGPLVKVLADASCIRSIGVRLANALNENTEAYKDKNDPAGAWSAFMVRANKVAREHEKRFRDGEFDPEDPDSDEDSTDGDEDPTDGNKDSIDQNKDSDGPKKE